MEKIESVLQNKPAILKKLGSKKENIYIVNKICLVASSSKISSEKVLNTLIQDNRENISEVIGYTIKNVGNTPIKNILLPIYSEKGTVFKGKVEKITLEPGKSLVIPTKWLVLLLSRVEYGFQTKEGTFVKNSNLVEGDIDKQFRQYQYNKELPVLPVGIHFTTTNLNYIQTQYQNIFGYLYNKLNLKEVKITSNAARFLSLFK